MRPTVLVVDDEPLLLSVLRRALQQDLDVVACADAREALSQIRGGARYAVILCDVSMPGMNGIEFHRALTALAPDQATRTIFLSGGGFDERTIAFLDQAQNACLQKPFDLRAVQAMVKDAAARATK